MQLTVAELSATTAAWLPIIIQYSGKLILAATTLILGWWLINKITQKIGIILKKKQVDPTLHGFIRTLTNIMLKIPLIISVASMIGIETSSFIAALGAIGLAIGLALQGSLANFAGGVLILLFRPFRVGDWIEAQSGVNGTVHSIQIFHTTLKTSDLKIVIVPNGSLSNGNITNYSREPIRRVDINLGIDYSSDIKQARKVLLDIAQDPRVVSTFTPVVYVTGLGDNAINITLRVWVENANYWPVTFDFLEAAKEKLTEAGIGIPFPQRVVHLVQASE
ncbi:MAG: mechanosensitive ion channel [Gammaproteobacteria bacterium]|nr:mechanosensitive ion channel [Gammaproteobacteria bacterium]